MGIADQELQTRLWKEFQAGNMPTGIRIRYQAFYAWTVDDPVFYSKCEWQIDKPPTYEGLQITFDNWYNQPKIETKRSD